MSHRVGVAVYGGLEIIDENVLSVPCLVHHMRRARLIVQLLEVLAGQGEGLDGGND